jgi:hypothetical protein
LTLPCVFLLMLQRKPMLHSERTQHRES